MQFQWFFEATTTLLAVDLISELVTCAGPSPAALWDPSLRMEHVNARLRQVHAADEDSRTWRGCHIGPYHWVVMGRFFRGRGLQLKSGVQRSRPGQAIQRSEWAWMMNVWVGEETDGRYSRNPLISAQKQ
ncbi:hypothetical protein CMUS01_02576 [Colletotrichum musicola]|uniref:Uncharacterized protein n=1 Tax=Colletotrichum musicola TaxID=2175873 RepID=A0A8H6NUL9_9PEZI|nr:hypothetical protein CMUS01_02576 [Colletotrichum musicola]